MLNPLNKEADNSSQPPERTALVSKPTSGNVILHYENYKGQSNSSVVKLPVFPFRKRPTVLLSQDSMCTAPLEPTSDLLSTRVDISMMYS